MEESYPSTTSCTCQLVIAALKETIRLMEEIDRAILSWPMV